MQNNLALILGGSGAIGSAIACALAADGRNIVITYRDGEDRAKLVQKQIVEAGAVHCEIVRLDLTDRVGIGALADLIAKKYGGVYALIHAASPLVRTQAIEETPAEDFEEQWNVHVLAMSLLMKSLLPFMKVKKTGVIIPILTSCILGVPPAKWAPYVSAKYALLGLCKTLSHELGPWGIRVNMISPGMVDTAFTAHIPESYKKMVARQIPLGRLCSLDDIAASVRFLCSEEARFLTGVNIPVTGGLEMSA